jgi:hypothetical protein
VPTDYVDDDVSFRIAIAYQEDRESREYATAW